MMRVIDNTSSPLHRAAHMQATSVLEVGLHRRTPVLFFRMRLGRVVKSIRVNPSGHVLAARPTSS